MGNKASMIFKNYSLPNVQLKQQPKTSYKVLTGINKKQVDFGIDPKYKYETHSMKNQKILKEDDKLQIKDLKSLKILTYNIWFEQHNIQNRIKALLKIIKQSDADIICLQQVTNDFIQALWKNSKQMCEKGELFIPAVPMSWYDTVIITKIPMAFYKIPFLSGMSRSLLMGTFQLINQNNELLNCSINCVHLQSLSNEKLRIDQLKVIQKINQQMDIVMVAGDMNFSDNWNEDIILQKDYIDLWRLLRQKDEQSWTMPTTTRFPQWRPDHIVIKNNKIKNEQFRKQIIGKIQRIGAFTIAPYQSQQLLKIGQDSIVRTPSDHMGLLANIMF